MEHDLGPSEVADVRRMLEKGYTPDTMAHIILTRREVGQHNRIIAEIREMVKNVDIPGKWKWIERECLKRGFTGAAFEAGKIEDALFKTYGRTVTPAWADYYRGANLADTDASPECIRNAFNSRPFCYGCFKAPFGGCSDSCEFGKKYGFCGIYGSLFSNFKAKWDRERDLQQYQNNKEEE